MSSAAAVGLDLIEIARLEGAIERRPRIAERLFTPAELDFARARRRPGRHLAARFAAKEAAIKALGGGAIPPRDVEVRGGGTEAPRYELRGRAADAADAAGVRLALSLTHSREIAAAVAVATSDESR
jgi:holo-[acyl-carrier protein] synthase